MRPTIEEQLLGTCRVLEGVVAPYVSDPYAANILKSLVSNLRMLDGALPAVPAFLRWDNEKTSQLLAEVHESAAPHIAVAIAQALDEPVCDVADLPSLDERNERLRELLTQVLRGGTLDAQLSKSVLQHLIDRASRFPMRFALPTPSTPSESSS